MRASPALVALWLFGCSSEYVVVGVHALPAGVTSLNVRSALDEQPAHALEQFGQRAGGFGSDTNFALNLAGARGRLSVSVEAWVGGCAVASQSADLNLAGSDTTLELTLDKIDPQDCSGGYQHLPDMVRVPGARFTMGCDGSVDPNCETDEKPLHFVTLSSYFIDRTEVSAAAYHACVAHGPCPRAIIDQSATTTAEAFITWAAAKAFCEAPGRGKRLATEAEWELAARGTDGRIYPWGNDPASCDKANYEPASGQNCFSNPTTGFIGPIDQFRGTSPYGAIGMAGNVEEWVADWYASPYAAAAVTDPTGPATGVQRVLRGGSWISSSIQIRASRRNANAPDASSPTIPTDSNSSTFGIRCARSQ